MNTPTRTFRLQERTLKNMDKLITNQPSVIVDGTRGAARNRTELVELLVKRAMEAWENEKEAAKK